VGEGSVEQLRPYKGVYYKGLSLSKGILNKRKKGQRRKKNTLSGNFSQERGEKKSLKIGAGQFPGKAGWGGGKINQSRMIYVCGEEGSLNNVRLVVKGEGEVKHEFGWGYI